MCPVRRHPSDSGGPCSPRDHSSHSAVTVKYVPLSRDEFDLILHNLGMSNTHGQSSPMVPEPEFEHDYDNDERK